MKRIILTGGESVMVDDSDFETLDAYSWHIFADRRYASRMIDSSEKSSGRYMHRIILGVTDPKLEVDHIDGNGLNNQRYNLRVCTHADNIRNQKPQVGRYSKYKGVSKASPSGLLRARVKFEGKEIIVGYFRSEAEAAKAYNEKAKELFGDFARLNVICE